MGCGVRLARPTVVAILPAYLLYTTVLFGNYVVQQQLLQNQVCSQRARGRAGMRPVDAAARRERERK